MFDHDLVNDFIQSTLLSRILEDELNPHACGLVSAGLYNSSDQTL